MNDTSTSRPASKLGKLKAEQREAIYAHCSSVSLADGVRWLEAEYNVQIGTCRLATWLRKRRGEESLAGVCRKTRPDCKIGMLRPEQQAAIFAHCEGVSLEEGAVWLKGEFGVSLCSHNLGTWLRKERIRQSIAPHLDAISDDRDRALLIGEVIGSATTITKANSVLISQAIFEEFRKPAGQRDQKYLAQYMGLALKATEQELKARSIDLGYDRFHFDTAKKATECAAQLQKIDEGGGDEREKIQKAIVVLFGERPSNTEIAA
jgi:hypothetical protein